MNASELPSPGMVSGSHALRKEVARVISQAKIGSNLSPGATTKQVEDLITFFKAALRETMKLRVREAKPQKNGDNNETQ